MWFWWLRSIQMQSHPEKESITMKKEANEFTGSSFTGHLQSTSQEPIDVQSTSQEPIDVSSSSSSSSSSFSSSSSSEGTPDEDDKLTGNASNQLVLYNPWSNDTREIEAVSHSDPIQFQPLRYPRHSMRSRVLPSVGAFTVQCAVCFKWRLIPTKEKYEEIREHILQRPFVCETAREWRPDISCDDPADISQDGSRLWAIDKPNIAQPPPGWKRLLRIRGEGSTKFADVYYQAPSGKRLRSMVEIQKYLMEHPEFLGAGITLSQFSFQIPKPLQENYVRKRPACVTASHDNTRPLEPAEVNPLAWASPDNGADLQLGPPALPPPNFEASDFDDVRQPPKKKARKTLSKRDI